ncbi:MAG: hypothetical protein AVDCRST_MAG72-2429, partial [uncultured Nocardioidaceae bacterium]
DDPGDVPAVTARTDPSRVRRQTYGEGARRLPGHQRPEGDGPGHRGEPAAAPTGARPGGAGSAAESGKRLAWRGGARGFAAHLREGHAAGL